LLTLIVQPPTEVTAAGAAAAVSGGGLEVFDQRSEEWVQPPLGAVVVMVGHTLEKASSGVFRATRHRVIRGTEERLSFAFQIRGQPEAAVSVDEINVPRGIRRGQATAQTTVGELMRHFDESHTSVVGQHASLSSSSGVGDGGASSETQNLEQQAKRARIFPSTGASGTITLSLRDWSKKGEKTSFTLKPSTRLEKMFSLFAQQKGVAVSGLRFLYEGMRINPAQTPLSSDLKNGDEIDVHIEQGGD
jgi:small ubiquitin-related modifier